MQSNNNNRIYFLDNLRTIIVFLVVLLHACGPYLMGDTWEWFWIVDDPANNSVSGIIFLIMDVFLMATLFFISGYLAPMSLERKNGSKFIIGKIKRLLIPWLISVITLIPLYKVIFLASRGLPQQHWTTYSHITNPNSQNWLWFLPVLFLFNLIYMLLTKIDIKLPRISLVTATVLTFLVGTAYTFNMDIFGLRGWTLTPILDFQNERILLYFMFFLLGTHSYKRKVFYKEPKNKRLYIIVNSISWLPINVYLFFILWPIVFNPGNFLISRIIDRSIVAITFNMTLIAMAYTLVESFRLYGNKNSKFWKYLNQNSYYVYIIHVVVMGLLTWLLRPLGIPSIVKQLLLTLGTFAVCNLLISAARLLINSIITGRKNVTAKSGNQA